MISVERLTKSYGAVHALRGISFEVGKGEVIGLLGPNGAGKTTAMKILTGYLHPTDGSAKIGGIDVVDQPIQVQSMIGYLPENAPLYLDMAVQEYLLMLAELRQIPPENRQPLIADAVRSTALSEVLTKTIGELSKGFRQRVGLAQAIMHRPQVLILDEPTSGLDPTQIVEIRRLIIRLAESTTVMISTHILSEVEAMCSRAIIIMRGEIKADAKLDELKTAAGAVVGVSASAPSVESALSAIPGVRTVSKIENGGAWARYRVTAEKDNELCPRIFDLAKEKSWRLSELRREQRTLESVFRELDSGAAMS